MTVLDQWFDAAGERIGVPSDYLKLITCLVLAYPLSHIFLRIPASRPNLRHSFNLACTAIFLLVIFHLYSGTANLVGSALATYAIVWSGIGGRWNPWIVMVGTMAHLLVFHVDRAINGIPLSTIEISGSLMVLLQRVTTFAWNVHDGRMKDSEIEPYQRQNRLTELPSLLAFLGYALYFPAILVGPSFPYSAYASLINGSIFSAHPTTGAPSGAAILPKPGMPPRGRRRAGYRRFAFGLVFLAFYAVYGGRFTYEGLLPSGEAWGKGLLQKIWWMQKAGFVARSKYYAVWAIAEGACIVGGLGFNGFTEAGRTRWDRVRNIDVLSVEFAQNYKLLLDAWNMNTNVWLRSCVYRRVTPKGKKPGFRSTMATFGTSALWHGIAAGYYLTFLMGGFLQTLGRLLRLYVRPFFLPPKFDAKSSTPPPSTTRKIAYDLISIVFVQLTLNFIVAPFLLLNLRDSLAAWRSVGFYGLILTFAPIVFFQLGGKRLLRSRIAKREAKYLERIKRDTLSNPVQDWAKGWEESYRGEATAEGRKEAGRDEELLTGDVDFEGVRRRWAGTAEEVKGEAREKAEEVKGEARETAEEIKEKTG